MYSAEFRIAIQFSNPEQAADFWVLYLISGASKGILSAWNITCLVCLFAFEANCMWAEEAICTMQSVDFACGFDFWAGSSGDWV